MEWRRLEGDETLLALYADGGAVGAEIAALEARIFDPEVTDPVLLARLKGQRQGLLGVMKAIKALAEQERDRRGQEEIHRAAAAVKNPADRALPRVF